MKNPRHRRLVVTAAVAALVALGAVPISSAPASAATPAPSTAAGGFAQANTALGPSWSSSGDVSVVGIGDSAGYHIMVAKESDAFRWKNLVTLTVPALSEGLWTGEVCTTGDGRYAVAVYAPSAAVNTPDLVESGALAAVVNLATGKTTAVAAGVQLAYHTPSCGAGDEATLTRALGADEQQTQILDVNAAAGAVTSIKTVKAQVTNVVPAGSGDYGVVAGSLVRIESDGQYTPLAKLPGEIYGAVATNRGIDLATAASGTGTISHWTGTKLENLGSGALGSIRLYQQAGGTDEVLGDTGGIEPGDSGVKVLSRPTLPDAVSLDGDLIVTAVDSAEVDATTDRPLADSTPAGVEGRISISAVATRTGAKQSGTLTANGPTFIDTASDEVNSVPVPQQAATTADYSLTRIDTDNGAVVKTPESELGTTSLLVQPANYTPGTANPAPNLDSESDVDLSDTTDDGPPTCLVPRNSVTDQVLQPNDDMVEWAVDQAVHGDLTLTRPANYLQTGQAAYSPQTMFPPVTLSGGGTIPAQVLLGIFAQESNFRQASPHALAGNSGNPLISDYYGTAYYSGTADNPDVVPDYSHSDCGYGLGQVTDGMSSLDITPYTTAQATAVATDYAANVAASAQILGTTWNQLAAQDSTENDGSAQYIENWFGALWAYNSGVHLESDASANDGDYGLGWLNNPANPNYPADRYPFGDNLTTTNDASVPQLWSYEEKVMGWIAHPQVSDVDPNFSDPEYSLPTWGQSKDKFNNEPSENLPENTATRGDGLFTFCGSQNSCTSAAGCPDDSSACWWHGPVSWIPSEDASTATTESLAYSLGAPEPAIDAANPADCPNQTAFTEQFNAGTYIVNTLSDPAQNTRGCAWSGSDGKFALRLGDNISLGDNRTGAMQSNVLSAQIDLHQIGAGFLGHYYFTHAYDGTEVNTASDGCVAVMTTNTGVLCKQFDTPTQVPTRVEDRIVGQWTPNIPATASGELYLILAALPANGGSGAASGVSYRIDVGMQANGNPYDSANCTIDQGVGAGTSDRWVELGVYELYPFADVRMGNMVVGASNSGEASNDVAYSSMIFEPVTSTSAGSCGQIESLSVN
jgi:hypothetical protein